MDAMEVDFEAEGWAQGKQQQLLEGTVSLVTLIEELRPLLYGPLESQERAIESIVILILKLPTDYLKEDEVLILLRFLCPRIDSSGLVSARVVDAIRHLVLECAHVSPSDHELLFKYLFQEGNVQAWPAAQRIVLYEILEYLIVKRRDAVLPLGSEFVLAFFKSIGGERDPRCLLVSFRLFCLVASQFPMGPFVEEMFETIACYYPIQFKPKGDDVSITRSELSEGCESALLAHPSFAPFCYLLIEEKLTEDDLDLTAKGQVCLFLSRCVRVFPSGSVHPHLTSLLPALRTVSFHPSDKEGECVPSALDAFQAICETVNVETLENVANITIENVEPFVLQAEMGLSPRAFSLLECVARTRMDSSFLSSFVSRVLSWTIMLVQGKNATVAANKGDVARDGLTALVRWVAIAADRHLYELLLGQEESLFLSVEESRSVAPVEASRAIYECAKIYLSVAPDALHDASRYVEMDRRGLYANMDEQETDIYLEYVAVFASRRWNEHMKVLEEAIPLDGEHTEYALKRLRVLCASVISVDKWEALKKRIFEEVESTSTSGLRVLSSFLVKLHSSGESIDMIVRDIVRWILELHESILFEGGEDVLQEVGAHISPECHRALFDLLLSSPLSPPRLRLFSLFLLQSPVLPPPSIFTASFDLLVLLYFYTVNRLGRESKEAKNVREKVPDEQKKALHVAEVKADLMAGRKDAVQEAKELFSNPEWEEYSSSLLDFSGAAFHPDRAGLSVSVLWQQRIQYQLAPILLSCLSSLDAPSQCRLLSSLQCLLRLSPGKDNLVLAPFLPVLVDLLSSLPSSPSFFSSPDCHFLLESLKTLIDRAEKTELSREVVTKLADSLCSIVEDDKCPLRWLLCSLECLSSLLRSAPPSSSQPSISRVLLTLTICTGHRKRCVRLEAAQLRNRWELLSTI